MIKVLIAVPTFENIMPDTFKAIYDLEKPEGVETLFEFVRGYDCAAARNRIVQKAQDLKVDYLFMIDNDVTVPKNALKCFLEDPKDVCLGFYAYRPANNVYSGKICLCKLGEYNYTDLYTANEFETLRLAGTYREKIHGGGMGCAFINMKVFNKIKYPYYYWKQYENGGTLSEDLWFCSQCAKNKIDIYGDTRVGCGHMLRKIQGVM